MWTRQLTRRVANTEAAVAAAMPSTTYPRYFLENSQNPRSVCTPPLSLAVCSSVLNYENERGGQAAIFHNRCSRQL